jgi:hypothetical protein
MATSDALRRLATSMTQSAGVTVRHRLGMVSSVVANGATDGHASVTVTVGSSAVTAPYLESYTSPAVGDLVMVLLVDRSPLILGRIVGLPAF